MDLPPPPPMESGFVLRAEPTRQASQKKKQCESRGDLLVAIRKGRSTSLQSCEFFLQVVASMRIVRVKRSVNYLLTYLLTFSLT